MSPSLMVQFIDGTLRTTTMGGFQGPTGGGRGSARVMLASGQVMGEMK